VKEFSLIRYQRPSFQG